MAENPQVVLFPAVKGATAEGHPCPQSGNGILGRVAWIPGRAGRLSRGRPHAGRALPGSRPVLCGGSVCLGILSVTLPSARLKEGFHRVAEVVVVGSGIIGLGVAYELARRGARVTVLDARAAGLGATQASAGVLAPYIEAPAQGAAARPRRSTACGSTTSSWPASPATRAWRSNTSAPAASRWRSMPTRPSSCRLRRGEARSARV